MEYKLQNDDYVDLWKYFDEKATSVKGAMFNTTTWVIGFASALLCFIFVNLAKFESTKAVVSLSTLITVVSIAGLAICLYAFFALGESAKHIRNNWEYANHCKSQIEGMEEIFKAGGNNKVGKIWNQLRIIVAIFTIAFISLLVYAHKLS